MNDLAELDGHEQRVEAYVDTGVSCPELRVKYDVDIREFVILACLSDVTTASMQDIARIVGLSPTSVESCLSTLVENGLIRSQEHPSKRYALTTDGIALVRKAGG